MIDSSHGWSGANTVSSVTPRAASKPTLGGEPLAGGLGVAHEARVRDLVRQVDLEPVGRIVARDIGVELGRRPVRRARRGIRPAPSPTRCAAVDLGEAAGQHRLGLVIERAQQLRLPAVPDARADRADVGGGQDQSAASCARATAPRRRNSRSSCGRRGRATARSSTSRRCFSTSQATVSVSAGDKPSRGQSRRAMRAPAIE